MTLQSSRSAINLELIMNSNNMPAIPVDLVGLNARQIRQTNAKFRKTIEISTSRVCEVGSEYGRPCSADVWSSRYWLAGCGFMDVRKGVPLYFS